MDIADVAHATCNVYKKYYQKSSYIRNEYVDDFIGAFIATRINWPNKRLEYMIYNFLYRCK